MTADPLVDEQISISVLVLGGGLLVALVPGPFATMDEAFDAAGTTRDDVEPTRWRVLLVRLAGVVVALIGARHLLVAAGLAGGFLG